MVAGAPLALIGLNHCRRVFLWTGSVNSCAASRYGTAQILFFATVDMLRIRKRPGSRSDRRDNGFVGPARRAIIDQQIEAGFLRFDASQQQRPAAFGTGRPKIINELVFWDLCHSAEFMITFPGAKASQLCRSGVGLRSPAITRLVGFSLD
jgi:hypothetical protein